MRRVTVHKTVEKSARRERESREAREGADRSSRERPEVRRDVLRVWWPAE